MKTYEQELNELFDWMTIKDQEYIEARKKDTSTGRDSKLEREQHQVVLEYNRRLIGLKEKYDKGLNEDEQRWKSANM